MKSVKNWLKYYKNSLSDSENLAVDISRIKNLFEENNLELNSATINSKNASIIIDAEEQRINRLKGVTKKDSPKWKKVADTEISIAPFRLEYQSSQNGFHQKTVYPFWVTAKVNRSGQLSAPKEVFPLIARDYLDPIVEKGNGFIFSSIDRLEMADTIEKPAPIEDDEEIPWDEYWAYINAIFSTICNYNLHNYQTIDYSTSYKAAYFATSSKISTAKSILFLYQNLVSETDDLPLLSKLINPTNRIRKTAITDSGFLDHNYLHVGQMSDEFPLSISQRKSLLSHLTAEENAITAVNGPPGTGKTTLLQSLVATEVVKAAIAGKEAPIILACSANNQAVTNIIDSFVNAESSMEDLADRWIPDFHGYATYLPSNSKSEKALENINFLKGNLFGHEGTLCDLENEEFVDNAAHHFLERYNDYFNDHISMIDDACDHLQQEIISVQEALTDGGRIGSEFLSAKKQINNILLRKEDAIEGKLSEVTKLKEWRTLLTRLKSISDKPEFSTEFKRYFSVESSSNITPESISECVFKIDEASFSNNDNASLYIKDCIKIVSATLKSALEINNWKFKNNIKGDPIVSEEDLWDFEYRKISTDDKAHKYFYDEMDLTLRHKAFLLAIHYWEARWILETSDVLENKTEKGTGEKPVMAKWKRRAMLTPCFVSTFYMAPAHFLYSKYQGENEAGNPSFDYLPLYDFLDLLIIDEAGQVTPEVSIPVFSLAKKAIVVGDLKQIEPIWSIPPKIDFGNLSNENITSQPAEISYLQEVGFLASSGSIMKMAQNACEYETPLISATENGLLLLEHRRCNDEIIGFCNELAYEGILKPMKGKAHKDQIFPSMMAYHIEGASEKKFKSRCNQNEVSSIVTWLAKNRESIETAYDVESVESVLGIITPFTSQKMELTKALSTAGFKVNKIKLGTVHALQGAERNIVLFSSVYSNEDEGTLFFDKDNKPNMLNVAVSRARDSFILFGDTRVFDETKDTPSGVLKKHLEVFDMASI